MGKTTTLFTVWKEYLTSDKYPIPIYVDLRDYFVASDSSKFIYNYLRTKYFNLFNDNSFNQKLDSFLSKVTGNKPKLLFLLDGFNELTDINKTGLLNEIAELKAFKLIQIVIASRYIINEVSVDDFSVAEIQRWDKEQIISYLNKQTISEPDNNNLFSLFYNPMMLAIYGKIYQTEKKYKERIKIKRENAQINNRGELFWHYQQVIYQSTILDYDNLSERYPIKNKLGYKSKIEMEEEMEILFHYFLPFVGKEIENKSVSGIVLENLIDDFNQWWQAHSQEIAQGLNKSFTINSLTDRNEVAPTERIQLLLQDKMGLVEIESDLEGRTGKKLKFIHQEYVDYFTALHIINEVTIFNRTKALDRLAILGQRRLNNSILTYLADLTGEGYRIPVLSNGHWLTDYENPTCFVHPDSLVLRKGIDNLRGFDFEKNYIKLSTFNLVHVLKAAKNDFSGEDFSNLYLKGIGFNGIYFSRLYNETEYITCNFKNSIINLIDFLPRGHQVTKKPGSFSQYMIPNACIYHLKYADNGKRLTSGSNTQMVYWRTDLGAVVENRSVPIIFDYGLVRFSSLDFGWETPQTRIAQFSPDKKYAVTVIRKRPDNGSAYYDEEYNENFIQSGYVNELGIDNGWVGIWDIQNKPAKIIQQYQTFKGGWYLIDKSFSIIAIHSLAGNSIEIRELFSGTLISNIEKDCLVKACSFHPQEKKLLTVSQDGKTEEWDYAVNPAIHVKTFELLDTRRFYILGYTPDLRYITACFYNYISSGNRAALHPIAKDIYESKHPSHGTLLFIGYQTSDAFMLKQHQAIVRNIDFTFYNNQEKERFATASDDGQILEWGYQNDSKEGTLSNNNDKIQKFSTGADDGSIIEWDYQNATIIQELSKRKIANQPNYIKYTPDGQQLLVVFDEGTIQLYDAKTLKLIHTNKGRIKRPFFVEFSSKGNLAIIFEISLTIDPSEIWDVHTLTKKCDIYTKDMLTCHGKFSPDGSKIVVWAEHEKIASKNIETAQKAIAEENWEAFKEIKLLYLASIYDTNSGKELLSTVLFDAKIIAGDFILHNDIVLFFDSIHGKIFIWDLPKENLKQVSLNKSIKAVEKIDLTKGILSEGNFSESKLSFSEIEKIIAETQSQVPFDQFLLAHDDNTFTLLITDGYDLQRGEYKFRTLDLSNFDVPDWDTMTIDFEKNNVNLHLYHQFSEDSSEYEPKFLKVHKINLNGFVTNASIKEIEAIFSYTEKMVEAIDMRPYGTLRRYDFNPVKKELAFIEAFPIFYYFIKVVDSEGKERSIEVPMMTLDIHLAGCNLPFDKSTPENVIKFFERQGVIFSKESKGSSLSFIKIFAGFSNSSKRKSREESAFDPTENLINDDYNQHLGFARGREGLGKFIDSKVVEDFLNKT